MISLYSLFETAESAALNNLNDIHHRGFLKLRNTLNPNQKPIIIKPKWTTYRGITSRGLKRLPSSGTPTT